MDPKYKLLSELGKGMIERWLAKHPEWSAWLDRRAGRVAETVNAKAAAWDLPVEVDGPKVKLLGTTLAASLFVVGLPLIARLQEASKDEEAKDDFVKSREDALFKVIKRG